MKIGRGRLIVFEPVVGRESTGPHGDKIHAASPRTITSFSENEKAGGR